MVATEFACKKFRLVKTTIKKLQNLLVKDETTNLQHKQNKFKVDKDLKL